MSKLGSAAVTLIAGGAMLVLSMSPGSAFTLSSPNLESSVASSQIDKVWWRGGCGWRGCGVGYGRGWGGYHGFYRPGYWGAGHCWRGYYGHVHCN